MHLVVKLVNHPEPDYHVRLVSREEIFQSVQYGDNM